MAIEPYNPSAQLSLSRIPLTDIAMVASVETAYRRTFIPPSSPAFILLLAALLTSCGGATASTHDHTIMTNDSSDTSGIRRALAAIESPGYFDDTYAASYHQVVEAILLEKPELQLLRAHCAQACPMVLARMKSPGDAAGPAMIAYALIVRESREIDAIPVLVDRIRMFDVDNDSADALLSPWHPFLYCMNTLEALTGGTVTVGSIDNAVRERARIIDAALEWYAAHKGARD